MPGTDIISSVRIGGAGVITVYEAALNFRIEFLPGHITMERGYIGISLHLIRIVIGARYGIGTHRLEFGQRHLVPIIKIPVLFGRYERQMGTDETDGQEERFVASAQRVDPCDGFIGDTSVEIGIVRNIDAFGHRFALRQHVDRRLGLYIRFRPRNRIVVVGFVRERMIHLADADRLVAVRSEELREGDDFRIIAPENAVERPYSRMIGPQSGENAGACRAA